MKKIPTLFVRDPSNHMAITREIHPDCGWVFAGEGRATRKYDGVCILVDHAGKFWTRREVKPGKREPDGFVAVATDGTTGKTVGWEPGRQSSWWPLIQDAATFGALEPGTYELCGPKINKNPEGFQAHTLVGHAVAQLCPHLDRPTGYDQLELAIQTLPWEGIVWHHPDGRMAKLKRRDFAQVARLAP